MQSWLEPLEKMVLKRRRKRLSQALFSRFQGWVQRGPFTGLQLAQQANISQASLGLKLFGLYETPVLEQLIGWSPCQLLINLGAGDGYFPVGMLQADLVERAICFEMTPSGRRAIEESARINGVLPRLEIHGEANASTVQGLLDNTNWSPESTILLCDIEGAEFELWSEQLLSCLAGTRIIVELHDRLSPQWGNAARNRLIERMASHGRTQIIRDGPRAWQGIEELECLHDLDRALITSEGRKILGEWLIADFSRQTAIDSAA